MFKDKVKGWLRELKVTFKILRRNRAAFVGLIIFIGFLFMAYVGPYIRPYNEIYYNFEERFVLPSLEHPLGTDYRGRDTLAQMIDGSTNIITVALLTGLFSTFLSFSIGMVSGYLGGKVDRALMFLADVFLVIPSFPLLLLIAAVVGRTLSPLEIAGLISIVGWAGLARAVRSQVLSIKSSDFIEAARCLGLSTSHIVFREILSNLTPYLFMSMITSMVGAIYSQTGLAYLGLLPLETTNWGFVINTAMYTYQAFFSQNLGVLLYFFVPVSLIVLLQSSLVMLLSGLEEVFNPRLRTEA